MDITQADLAILTEIDAKIEYFEKRITELKAEKRYFYNKGDSYR
jgi:hypothetical protein|tara:strand:- start:195 stop:326 length:132 start_codon:yes stop_codon:yes gene_type:complete